MNLNWSNRVIKYVLFIFNLLFVISGIIMIAVGVSVKAYYTDYDIFLGEKYFSLPNLLIAIGSLIFFISFFGCCGAIRESWFMIFVFSILLSLIFILEFSAGIAGYVLRDDTASYLTDELHDTMSEYVFGGQNITKASYTYMWDRIQKEFECCGASGPGDWAQYHKTTIPTSSVASTVPSSVASTVPSSVASTVPSTVKSTASPATTVTTPTSAPPVPLSEGSTAEPPKPAPNNARRRRAIELPAIDFGVSRNETLDLPASCCKPVPGASGLIVCNLNDTSTANYYSIGCVEGFGDYLKDHAVTLGGVGIAIALIQLFGVIFACHLAKQLKNGFYST